MAAVTMTEIMLGNLLLDKLIELTLTAADAAGKTDAELKAMIDKINEQRKIEIDKIKARQSDSDPA